MPFALDLNGGGDCRSNTQPGGFDCGLSSDMVRLYDSVLRG